MEEGRQQDSGKLELGGGQREADPYNQDPGISVEVESWQGSTQAALQKSRREHLAAFKG